jgi:hypothetical protein
MTMWGRVGGSSRLLDDWQRDNHVNASSLDVHGSRTHIAAN